MADNLERIQAKAETTSLWGARVGCDWHCDSAEDRRRCYSLLRIPRLSGTPRSKRDLSSSPTEGLASIGRDSSESLYHTILDSLRRKKGRNRRMQKEFKVQDKEKGTCNAESAARGSPHFETF